MENIKKKIKNKNSIEYINHLRSSNQEKEKKFYFQISNDSCNISKIRRTDIFGNEIIKGGRKHKVSFSSHGDMKIVENWKDINLRLSVKPCKPKLKKKK